MATRIKKNVLLKDLTTFRIGGYARYFCQVNNKEELIQAVDFAKSKNIPIFILGGGSDILISEDGFPGLVIHYSNKSIKFTTKKDHVLITSGAGLSWDRLVAESVNLNLQGIECLSGIPGTVGAAPIQNIGAYGQELKNTFVSLNAYDLKNEKFVILLNEDCKFSYRDSIFKEKKYWQKYLILDITLKLVKNGKPEITYESLKNYLDEKGVRNPSLSQVRESVLNIRKTKFENYKDTPNAGSFFKNPIINGKKLLELKYQYPDIPCYKNTDGTYKCYAGWLIEKSGWKGKKLGNASVSSKHALVLTNPERKAKADEIKMLAEKIRKDVKLKFGIKLESEVQFIGF